MWEGNYDDVLISWRSPRWQDFGQAKIASTELKEFKHPKNSFEAHQMLEEIR